MSCSLSLYRPQFSTFRSVLDILCEMVEVKRYFFAAAEVYRQVRGKLKVFAAFGFFQGRCKGKDHWHNPCDFLGYATLTKIRVCAEGNLILGMEERGWNCLRKSSVWINPPR